MSTLIRNQAIDAAKGVAITAVVVIHASSLLGGGDLQVALVALARFAVPFFIISYVYFLVRGLSRSEKGIRGEAWGRFKPLLFPWIFWTAIWFSYNVSVGAPKVYELSFWFWNAWAGQYFFFACAQASIVVCILYGLLSGFTKERQVLILVITYVAFSLFDIYLIYGSDLSVIAGLGYYWFWAWVPVVSLGYLCTLGVFHEMPVAVARLAFVGLVGLFAVQMVYGSIRLDEALVYLQPLPVAAALVLFLQPRTLPVVNVLASLGRMSLGVFCLNPILLPPVKWLVVAAGLNFYGAIATLVSTVLVIVGSTFIILCLLRVPVLHRLVSTR